MAKEIWSSGVMGKNTKEHSLFLQLSNEQISIATGCSHLSPTQFLNSVRSLGKIYAILGRFHGFKELEILEHL